MPTRGSLATSFQGDHADPQRSCPLSETMHAGVAPRWSCVWRLFRLWTLPLFLSVRRCQGQMARPPTGPPRLVPRTLRAGLARAGVRRTTTRRGALRSRRPVASPSRALDIGNRPSVLPDRRPPNRAPARSDRPAAGTAVGRTNTGGRSDQDEAGGERRPRIRATTVSARAKSNTSMTTLYHKRQRPGARRLLRPNPHVARSSRRLTAPSSHARRRLIIRRAARPSGPAPPASHRTTRRRSAAALLPR